MTTEAHARQRTLAHDRLTYSRLNSSLGPRQELQPLNQPVKVCRKCDSCLFSTNEDGDQVCTNCGMVNYLTRQY